MITSLTLEIRPGEAVSVGRGVTLIVERKSAGPAKTAMLNDELDASQTIAEKLFLPNGIEFSKGSLYVATPKDITRYDNIEASLDSPPKPVMVTVVPCTSTPQPNWRSAASITRVSSESSRS